MSKPRPPNAAGPNGLRGGIKTYTPKTITGPWLEEIGGPAGYKRGFSTCEYETEAQHAQKGVLTTKPPEYGAALPDDKQLKLAPSPFTYNGNAKELFVTNTQLMSMSISSRKKENEIETALKPHLPPDVIENYRKTWTSEQNDILRKTRFTTETRLAASKAVNEQFSVESVRPLPGSPKALESLREQLITRYGLLAFMVVRYQFGKGVITTDEFREKIKGLGVELKLFEVNQIIAYITPSSTMIPIDKFIHSLRGNVMGFDRTAVDTIFHHLLTSPSSSSSSSVSLADIVNNLNQQDYPEIVDGFQQFATAYSFQGQQFTKTEFQDIFSDMFASNPLVYKDAIKNIWNL